MVFITQMKIIEWMLSLPVTMVIDSITHQAIRSALLLYNSRILSKQSTKPLSINNNKVSINNFPKTETIILDITLKE